jgi:hypothetical protein
MSVIVTIPESDLSFFCTRTISSLITVFIASNRGVSRSKITTFVFKKSLTSFELFPFVIPTPIVSHVYKSRNASWITHDWQLGIIMHHH